jgi:cell division septation protein DedD
MDDPALRDLDRNAERWRDKIELRLDNRQVFFLFFGSAVVACMLFVLGVMVGKRIESRGQAAAPDMLDPLAALDRVHTPVVGPEAPPPQLTFPNTLIAPAARTGAPAKVKAVKPPIVTAAVTPAKPAPVPAPVAPAKPAAAPVVAPRPAAPPKVVAPPAPPAPVSKPVAAAKPAAPLPAPKPAAPAPAAESASAAKAKGKFTLHLSTFATAEEANAFAQHYPGAFVISGDVPGRGMAYRVRYGNFPTYKDATAAKDSFEKQHNTIALVAAR